MNLRKIVVSTLICISCCLSEAEAGGEAWKFVLDSVNREPNGCYDIGLTYVDKHEYLGGTISCPVINVKACYNFGWFNTSAPSRTEYYDSISILKKVTISKEIIELGEMGEGLHSTIDNKCEYESNALKIWDEHDHWKGYIIVSYYKWP